jgi:hypothetical protein
MYDRKVAKAQREQEYVSKMEQRSEKKVAEQMLNQEATASYLDAIDDKIGQLLPADAERVRALEKEARQSVIQGVANSQGDYKQFMLQGGANVLREYKNTVVKSDQVTSGLKNMGTYKQIQKDMSEGKMFHNVDVTYKGTDGKDYTDNMDINGMMELFEAGKISNLDYNGAEKAKNIKPMDFFKNFHPNHPYEAKPVTAEEYREFAIMNGQSPDIAAKMAESVITDVNAQGEPITDMWWGIKDDDWTGSGRKWGANGRSKAGAAKFLPALELIQSMEPTSDRQLSDWTTRDGKTKQRMTIDGYNPGAEALDKIKGHLGLVLNRDGSYGGQINNSIGFFNMENGRSLDIKGSDYELISSGNEVQTVRNAETGETEMYMPVTIRVSEDFLEENGGEGAWWNGWTMEAGKEQWGGGVSKDTNFEGADMREIQVSVNIPLDPLSRENIDRQIGWKEEQVIGGMAVEDYNSAEVSRPTGANKPYTPADYRNINGQVFSNTPNGFGGSDADVYMQSLSETMAMIKSLPQARGKGNNEIRTLAEQYLAQNK